MSQMPQPPSRNLERALASRWGIVAGLDEVGRGALAGPVCVGAVAVEEHMGQAPEGLTDSKNLSPAARRALILPVQQWALASAVGWAEPKEVDSEGIIGALRLAAWRAIRELNGKLRTEGYGSVGGILLDGTHNWFTTRPSLLGDLTEAEDPRNALPVVTQRKADMTCTAVSAASIIAKVERDTHMEQMPDCGYHWSSNKGYASAAHREALVRLGASDQHRLSWNLFGSR